MGKVSSSAEAGSIIRRIREEKGISRAALSEETGVGARTLYALETGEADNFGLGRYLRLLDALGLDMDVREDGAPPSEGPSPDAGLPGRGSPTLGSSAMEANDDRACLRPHRHTLGLL